MNEAVSSGFFTPIPKETFARFAHQRTTTEFILDRMRCYVMNDPGTGKTVSSLDAFIEARALGLVNKGLTLAPKAILEAAWVQDSEKFTPELTLVPCFAEKRLQSFSKPADIYVTNHDAAKWISEHLEAVKGVDAIFIDEATAFKNKAAARSAAMLKIVEHLQPKMIVLLCGTPMPGGLEDLWMQMMLVDGGQRLGKSFYAFRNAITYCEPTPYGINKFIEKPGAREAVADLISDATIRFTLEECISMPEKIVRTVPFKMPAALRSKYDEMVRDAVLKLESGEVNAVNAAALLTKLLQISSGAVYDADKKHHVLDTVRYDLIASLCAEREQTLVAFNWTHQRDEILKALERAGIARKDIVVVDRSFKGSVRQLVEDFQSGKYRVLLAHPKSASHGLTLTRATTTIWASPTYDLERFIQFNFRTYRAGQARRTEFIMIAAEDSVDIQAYARLNEKDEAQKDVISLLQSLSR